MNVYEKLNEARTQFQNANKKMSGKNSFAGYSYYELSDILPEVNKICGGLKVACVVRYEKDLAYLDFVDCEKPADKITFTSPMSEANLKGCHAVQNLGAVETYIKRYLYQACFEIVESDILDGTMNPSTKNPNAKNQLPPPVQAVKTAFNGQVQKGGPATAAEAEEIKALLASTYNNGAPIFSKQEAVQYSQMRQNLTSEELIAQIKQDLQARIAGNQPAAEQQEIF